MNKINVILEFWFEGINDSTSVDKAKRPFNKWFKANPALDQEIRENFEADFKNALAGEYKNWQQTPQGALALILLCDQFARNMYRATPQMYSGDALALDLTKELIATKKEHQLTLIQRTFVYMPFMHAENLGYQRLSVECFHQLTEQAKVETPFNVHYYNYSLDYAKRHCVIIERFGRFPHRNKILGRVSTPEEIEFLKTPGSGF